MTLIASDLPHGIHLRRQQRHLEVIEADRDVHFLALEPAREREERDHGEQKQREQQRRRLHRVRVGAWRFRKCVIYREREQHAMYAISWLGRFSPCAHE